LAVLTKSKITVAYLCLMNYFKLNFHTINNYMGVLEQLLIGKLEYCDLINGLYKNFKVV